MPESQPALQPAPPAGPAFRFAALFQFRKPAAARWPYALRAAIAMGAPALLGWWLGDIPAGLMATTGAFTAVYGADRPFLNRAVHLAGIAAAFVIVVSVGIWAASLPWLVVPVITLIATLAAFLCSALRIGPPGAYLFTLACAAGTAMGAQHLLWWHVAALVLAGGGFAWLLHMAGALFAPRGPEIVALKAAGRAVGDFLAAAGTPRLDAARHQAAIALHQTWTVLVGQQPVRPRPDGTLSRLRSEARELHVIFAEAINAMSAGQPVAPAARERVAAIVAQPLAANDITDPGHVPLGRVSGWQLLREGMRPGAQAFEIGTRVAVAALISGLVGAAIAIDHAYWITAAAVLMLHQGLDWATTLSRGVQRVGGTLVGLVLAGAILGVHPEGMWLALTMMGLQFIIEILVIRNYGIAVIFITAVALTIASGGHPVGDVAHLLWTRAADTAIGCIIGLGVFAVMAPRATTATISHELLRSWAAIDLVAQHLSAGNAIAPPARAARRNLQHHVILLLQSFDAAVGNGDASRMAAEPLWPVVMATQRLAYRMLSAGWQVEIAAGDPAKAADMLFGAAGAAQLHAALADIAAAMRSGRAPAPIDHPPAFVDAELRLLSASLVGIQHPA
jgi:uncharacterized membrane protein YccC